jgi:hypothetical protein
MPPFSTGPRAPRTGRASSHRSRLAATLVAAGALLGPATPAAAQVLASERAVVSQVVNGATLTVEYYRPTVRGRTIFGKLVHWGETWTPGANWATTLESDRDLRIDGQPLPKGKYSVWITPRASGDWTVSFARKARRFHASVPDSSDIALRVPVRPDSVGLTERLTFSFPSVARDSVVLRMEWANVAVPLHVAMVRPPAPVLSAAEMAPYVGRYRFRYDGPDTTTYGMRVYVVAGGLEAMIDSAAAPPDLGPRISLVPEKANRFYWGTIQQGQFIGIEENLIFAFPVTGGRATGFEFLETNSGSAFARGTRVADDAPARRARTRR